jgi:hypothetical protein
MLVREIAEACNEQATGINQINTAIQNFNKITQEYAASAEQMASTSQNLATQSIDLKETVAYFKTDKKSDTKKADVKNEKRTTSTTNTDKGTTFSNSNVRFGEKRSSTVGRPVSAPPVKMPQSQPVVSKNKGTYINLDNDKRDSEYESF